MVQANTAVRQIRILTCVDVYSVGIPVTLLGQWVDPHWRKRVVSQARDRDAEAQVDS